MSEAHDPPLRLAIQGMRWLGDEFKTVRDPVEFTLHGTDVGDSATILHLLRQAALLRADMSLLGVTASREALDFGAPNHPTDTDLDEMVQHAQRLLDCLHVLRELSPEIVSDENEGAEDA